jgi:DNA-binding CsgD family transcriptional regulator
MLSGRERLVILVIFLSVSFLMGADVYDDIHEGAQLEHVIEELVIVFLSLIGFTYLWASYIRSRRENLSIREDLKKVRQDLDQYKNETQHLFEGLSHKVDDQLERWALTRSEKEVALLLLKGLSTKEIADVRHTSEKTISQQASAVYQKSGIHGRVELSAFFLEDLFLPPENGKTGTT